MIANIFFVVIGIVLIGYIYNNVRKHMMSQGESILWMIGACFILILAIFPKIIIYLSKIVGISYPPSLLFFLTSAFLLILLFRNSQQLSVLSEKNKELIQDFGLLDNRVRHLEKTRISGE
ncbi:MAG: DUF2304 domain-containing protein [Eubacteriaceae bacterium]|nr:DUF2304 domain-containing protein [Eubacteriaceae bacterium]